MKVAFEISICFDFFEELIILVEHVVAAFAMATNRVVAAPEGEIRLVLVVLHLEVVYRAVVMVMVKAPDQLPLMVEDVNVRIHVISPWRYENVRSIVTSAERPAEVEMRWPNIPRVELLRDVVSSSILLVALMPRDQSVNLSRAE